MKKRVFSAIIVAFLLVACSKTNEDTESRNSAGPGSVVIANCDTANMKYATNVQPIIKANCYSCHGNGNVLGGISLDTYAKLKKQVDNGLLIGVITHANGFDPMPQGMPKLSDCDINKIKSWVARGVQNN